MTDKAKNESGEWLVTKEFFVIVLDGQLLLDAESAGYQLQNLLWVEMTRTLLKNSQENLDDL